MVDVEAISGAAGAGVADDRRLLSDRSDRGDEPAELIERARVGATGVTAVDERVGGGDCGRSYSA